MRSTSHPTHRKFATVALLALATIVVASCGGGDSTAPTKPSLSGVATPTISGPITGGKGVRLGVGSFNGKPFGYEESEFFLSGSASAFTSVDALSEDGKWNVAEGEKADYTTRIVVRRPKDASTFNGTVYVEWLNVTAGFDTGPDWTFGSVEIQRSGAVWVGVSAQRVGVEGGGNELGAAFVLKTSDPERYGTLNHPGDDFSYDIFSQVGATVWRSAATVLDGLVPERVIALGESQSAFRMTTYINALAKKHDVYSGYFVHSRGSRAAQLSTAPRPDIAGPDPAFIRTDLKRPVLNFSSETDLVGDRLGYRRAEQDDSKWFRSWDVVGTAHADAYSLGIGDTDDGSGAADTKLFAALLDAPSSVYFGVINCERPINAGAHTYVLRSALRSLDTWVRTGTPPAEMPRMKVAADGNDYERDDDGIALGGIRTPQVDVPLSTLSGLGQSGESFCGLFGTTTRFTADVLTQLYPTMDDFVSKWNAATDAAVKSGALLEDDAARIKEAAAQGFAK